MSMSLTVARFHRPARALALALVMGTVAVACSGSSGGGGGGGAGGILRYGYDLSAQFTNTFDIGKTKGDCDQIVDNYIYDSLVHIDKYNGNKVLPELATSWDVPADGRSITFHLRTGVKFTDGNPFDADAAKWNLEHNAKNTTLDDFTHMTGVDVVDKSTIRIDLKDDFAVPFLNDMGDPGRMGIMASPKATDLNNHPVGTGPFTFASYTPGAKISIRRNPDYWGTEPKLAGIDYVQVGTGPPAVTALRSGQVDLIRFEPESYSTLKANSKVQVVAQPTGAYLQMQFRLGPTSPFNDVRIRQAVEYAVDRDEINRVVNEGLGEVASQPFPKSSASYNPSIANRYPHDPAKAKQLLAEAGKPNGFSFKMVIPGGNITNMERQGALLQRQLGAVGIKADIVRVLGSDIATQYYISRQGDAFAAEKLGGTLDAGQIYGQYGKFQFVAIYNNQEHADLDQLGLEAQSASHINDAAKINQEAAKIVMENAYELPIAYPPQLMAFDRTRVGGTLRGQTDICDPPDLHNIFMK
jgi:ABC-type transport system substrate-binding protein